MSVKVYVKNACQAFDSIKGDNVSDCFRVVKELQSRLYEYRLKDKNKFEKEIFKIARKKLTEEKTRSYTVMQKVNAWIYMYLLRKPAYCVKKILKLKMSVPVDFYIGPAYFWEYQQELNWCGYWGGDIIENIYKYEEILNGLNDEKSKLVLCHIMMARLSMDWKYYAWCCDDKSKEYFDKDIMNLDVLQTVIDGGGYNGDTYLHFCDVWGKEILRKWYLYEPDSENMKKAQKLLSAKENVVLREAGLYSETRTLRFTPLGTVASALDENGTEQVKVVSLDEDVKEKVTFIKLDIEGEEMSALSGAREHIVKDLPILAICIYHKKEDIWKLIEYVKGLNPNYKVYIRHYSTAHWDTVMYAIP